MSGSLLIDLSFDDLPTSPSAPISAGLSDEERAQKVCEEILSTEESYVNDLNVIIEKGMVPCTLILSEEEVRRIFSNISNIRDLNKQILLELNNPFDSVGEVFHRMSSYLKLYSIYCAHYSTSMDAVEYLKGCNQSFSQLCKNIKQETDLSLTDYLIKPVQRLLKYPLFFTELVKNTPQSSEDHPKLVAVLEILRTIAGNVNASTGAEECRKKVLEISLKLVGSPEGFSLVQPSRVYIKEGIFKVHHNRKKNKESVFLMSDGVLFTDPPTPKGQLAFKHFFNLVDIDFASDSIYPKDRDTTFDIIERNPKGTKIYSIITKQKVLKDAWLKEITILIQKNRELVRRRLTSSNVPPDAKRKSKDIEARSSLMQSMPIFQVENQVELENGRENFGEERGRKMSMSHQDPTASVSMGPPLGHRRQRSNSYSIPKEGRMHPVPMKMKASESPEFSRKSMRQSLRNPIKQDGLMQELESKLTLRKSFK
eukprot:TRINITY_DN2612_c0_g1_i1.p1 TRINITY_DN2612_c0_g1~~TRINITY_DN2612_c0_g1_i1.p1  ORF type:complete len:490 (-),score=126.53 TRINITY_DN2612_c0_g1_i1:41-1486(-)